MSAISVRLEKLRKLGAGDDQCVDCLDMGMHPMKICRQCIQDTPEFNRILNELLKEYDGSQRSNDSSTS